MLPAGDATFVQLVDDAFSDAAIRSGPWLACKAGCNQCCTGVFRVSPLDAERLREGLERLAAADAPRARRLLQRTAASVQRLVPDFPGDADTGILGEDDASLEAFEDFGNHEVCPVLDPETGLCELYSHRPLTCRTFGPPLRTEDGFGVCELCFVGAPPETVAACEMKPPPRQMEEDLTRQAGGDGDTVVAFALQTASPAPSCGDR